MQKIDAINQAIVNAMQRKSNLTPGCYNVPALSSLNIRNLMNNLGRISERYLEVGVHRGGLFCSTICNNKLLSATAIDSFASDEIFTDNTVEPEFRMNAQNFLMPETEWRLIKGDAFGVDLSGIVPVDLYTYDAGHSYDDQKNALIYYKPVLADQFIYCCDDWQFEDVKAGTQAGISEGGYDVLYDVELLTPNGNVNHDNESWWRGYYVALLQKK